MSSDAASGRGDHRLDPVRTRFIEAMARRASTHHGEARRILDERLATLVAAQGEDADKTACGAGNAESPAGQAKRSLLAELVEYIGQHTSSEAEPKALDYFRATWSRLSAERRLTQSLETVPEKAGPLNSHHLVHRSLTLMRELSPAYLHQFMSYVDTLLWLDQVGPGAVGSQAAGPASSPGSRARNAHAAGRR